MPSKYNDLSVKIISKLASYDLTNEITIGQIIQSLYEEGILSDEQRRLWSSEKGAFEFINLCQGVCTVLPVMNNDRLIRQSGAFLLPGKFNVSPREDKIQEAIISKAECNLREEFDKKFFYVNDENKETIRRELEHCNVSEANLFPELEYQLRYISKQNESQKRAVAYFEKFQVIVQNEEEKVHEDISYNQELVREIVQLEKLDDSLSKKIVAIFNENQEIDWIKRDSVLSRIKILICKKLIENQYLREDAERISSDIVKRLLKTYGEVIICPQHLQKQIMKIL